MSQPLTGLSAPGAAVHRIADQLAGRFTGVFARETVDRYVVESCTALVKAVPEVLFVCVQNAGRPGKRYADWAVRGPAGHSVGEVRAIRADIDARVQALLADLLPIPTPTS